jgi:hypothetical protein
LNINAFVTTARKKTAKRCLIMLSKVTIWQMTEEERLAYIERYPIKPFKKETEFVPDFKWRGQAAAEASKRERDKNRQT